MTLATKQRRPQHVTLNGGGRESRKIPETEYHDFVIRAERTSSSTVEVQVESSPAGRLSRPVSVPYEAAGARRLRESFRTGLSWAGHADSEAARSNAGRAEITLAEAIDLGRELAAVVFAPEVSRLFCLSLVNLARKPAAGLRLRLVFDASLVDLPWEYLIRPDRPDSTGMSAFLLLDPRISLVREAAKPAISIDRAAGKQRLAFVGTLWEGRVDGWEVRREFDLLCKALGPISAFLATSYWTADHIERAAANARSDIAIFHYAGHVDFDGHARPFLVREMPQTKKLEAKDQAYIEDLAPALRRSGVRLVVLSACNSGFLPSVKPLLEARIPAVIGVNGGVESQSTIEFCAKVYDSLAVGLSLDEAVSRARLHLMEWRGSQGPFDWGLYMVYLPSPEAVLFPRAPTAMVAAHQTRVEKDRARTIEQTQRIARDLDGRNFADIVSELSRRRVLILGRFTRRRLAVLEAMKKRLAELPRSYIPELFTFSKPVSRDLVESILAFAGLSRFIIADLTDPKSVPSELQAIVPQFPSVPVVPIIDIRDREYATFSSIKRRENVIKPTLRYRSTEDLLDRLTREAIPRAERKLAAIRPP